MVWLWEWPIQSQSSTDSNICDILLEESKTGISPWNHHAWNAERTFVLMWFPGSDWSLGLSQRAGKSGLWWHLCSFREQNGLLWLSSVAYCRCSYAGWFSAAPLAWWLTLCVKLLLKLKGHAFGKYAYATTYYKGNHGWKGEIFLKAHQQPLLPSPAMQMSSSQRFCFCHSGLLFLLSNTSWMTKTFSSGQGKWASVKMLGTSPSPKILQLMLSY